MSDKESGKAAEGRWRAVIDGITDAKGGADAEARAQAWKAAEARAEVGENRSRSGSTPAKRQ